MSEDSSNEKEVKISSLKDHHAFPVLEEYLTTKKKEAFNKLAKVDSFDCCEVAKLQNQIRFIELLFDKFRS